MVTPEEIAERVYRLLTESEVKSMITGLIDWERNDYSKEDVIVIPRSTTGEYSVQSGAVNVNIHVPDIIIKAGKKTAYRTNFPRLKEIRNKCMDVLKCHYEPDVGYNWTIGLINPPMKEVDHNEHFVSFSLDVTARYIRTN